MNDSLVSPAPPVHQALESLRNPAATPPPGSSGPVRSGPPDPVTGAAAADDSLIPEPVLIDVDADQLASVAPAPLRGGGSGPLSAALESLRAVSASAKTRLLDAEEFPDLPLQRELPDLGPYVEHVMREAQAAAAAYREETGRETEVRAAELIRDAAAFAERVRDAADAYGERTIAYANARLAERVRRIADLTEQLSKMAQRAGDQFAGDPVMREQMMQFISDLGTAAEEAASDLLAEVAHDALS